MKRKDLIDTIESVGCVLIRHGAKHDIYHNPKTWHDAAEPRHREIHKSLAKKIIRDLSNH